VLLLAGFVAIAVEVKAPRTERSPWVESSRSFWGRSCSSTKTAISAACRSSTFASSCPSSWCQRIVSVLFAGIAAKALRAPAQSGMETMRGVQGTARSRIGPDGGYGLRRWGPVASHVRTEVIEPDKSVVEEVMSNPTRLKVKQPAKEHIMQALEGLLVTFVVA